MSFHRKDKELDVFTVVYCPRENVDNGPTLNHCELRLKMEEISCFSYFCNVINFFVFWELLSSYDLAPRCRRRRRLIRGRFLCGFCSIFVRYTNLFYKNFQLRWPIFREYRRYFRIRFLKKANTIYTDTKIIYPENTPNSLNLETAFNTGNKFKIIENNSQNLQFNQGLL